MKFVRSILFIALFVHQLSGEESISKRFLEILNLGNYLNLSSIDSLFPDVKFDDRKWKQEKKTENFTEKCIFSQNYSNKYSNAFLNTTSSNDLQILNNYILAKLLKYPCKNEKPDATPRKSSSLKVWIYGFLTVTLNNVLAAFGVLFVPLMKKKIYHSVMTFMVALGIGALAGTSLLILIPDAMQIQEMAIKAHHNKYDYRWKATVVFLGLYIFFLTERFLKTLTIKTHHKHNFDLTNEKPGIAKELNETNGKSKLQIEDKMMEDRMTKESKEESRNIEHNLHNIEREDFMVCEKGDQNEHVKYKQAIAPVAWMVIFGDSLHNLVDGLSIGAAFATSIMLGISVSIAVICEELPHELGDFAILLTAGMTTKQAVFWNLVSAMTCYIGFILGAILGELSSAAVWIFAIAGGMFLYISLVDMMNNIIDTIDDMVSPWRQKAITFALQNVGLWTGYFTILILGIYGENIKFDF